MSDTKPPEQAADEYVSMPEFHSEDSFPESLFEMREFAKEDLLAGRAHFIEHELTQLIFSLGHDAYKVFDGASVTLHTTEQTADKEGVNVEHGRYISNAEIITAIVKAKGEG